MNNKPTNLQQAALAALFDPGDIVVTKQALHTPARYYTPTDQFLCVNAMTGPSTTTASVAKFTNFLVELDSGSPEEQWRLIVDELKMPFTVATFSGGKSIHFVVRVAGAGFENIELYKSMVGKLLKALNHAAKNVGVLDTSTFNPSRLTRNPGATRQGAPLSGRLQEIIEVRQAISMEDLIMWRLTTPKVNDYYVKLVKAEQYNRRRVDNGSKQPATKLPEKYQRLMSGKQRVQGSRHAALTEFGVWCVKNSYQPERLEENLLQMQEALGLIERNDVPELLTWLRRVT